MNTVNKPFRKKDAMQLVTGQPVYTDDVIPQDCLIVKLLRSPHANAMVRTINTTVAKKMCRRMRPATPRQARPSRRQAPVTDWSSTATSVSWVMWWPS